MADMQLPSERRGWIRRSERPPSRRRARSQSTALTVASSDVVLPDVDTPYTIVNEQRVARVGRALLTGITYNALAEELGCSIDDIKVAQREFRTRFHREFRGKSIREYTVDRLMFAEEVSRIAMELAGDVSESGSRASVRDKLSALNVARLAKQDQDDILKQAGFFASSQLLPARDGEDHDPAVAQAHHFSRVIDGLFGDDSIDADFEEIENASSEE